MTRRMVLAGLAFPVAAIGAGGKASIKLQLVPYAGGVSVRDVRFAGGAKGDGITDDTEAIQSAIKSATIIFIPVGTYMVSTSLIVPAGRHISGQGSASVLKKKHEKIGRLIVNAPGAIEGIVIERLTIDGSRVSVDYIGGNDGLFLTGCIGAVVRDVTVRNCVNDGIVIEYGSENRVTRCIAHDNAKDGIYSSGSKTITINENQTYGNAIAGIAVAATFGGLVTMNSSRDNRSDVMLGRDSRGVRVIDNDCRSRTAFVVSGESLSAQTLNGIEYPSKPARGWDWVYGASSCTLSRNYFGGEVRLILLNDSEVSDNTCIGSPTQGLLLQGARRNRIIHNTIQDWGADFYGVQLASLNAVDGAPQSQGLPIRSIENIITGNHLVSNAKRGAIIDEGQSNMLLANEIEIASPL